MLQRHVEGLLLKLFQQHALKQLKEAIELRLTHSELYEHIRIKPPKGVILYGKPRTDKTLLAKIHGKRCGTAPSEDNDTLFLGNIYNTWTKAAVRQKLKDYGIEGVERITLIDDPPCVIARQYPLRNSQMQQSAICYPPKWLNINLCGGKSDFREFVLDTPKKYEKQVSSEPVCGDKDNMEAEKEPVEDKEADMEKEEVDEKENKAANDEEADKVQEMNIEKAEVNENENKVNSDEEPFKLQEPSME
ncbi:nucleotide-binding alpha-beta plait domain-containing protein, partial [Tanacetum coccineum]